jgi:DNA primase
MRLLEANVDAQLLGLLARELHALDETLDLASELEGARQQLKQNYVQKNERNLLAQLGDKSLSTLSEEEKALLKTLGTKLKSKTS